ENIIEIGFLSSATAPHGIEKNAFYIKDNGIGIDSQYHQEIFRIFKRLQKTADDEQSTGSGLTFVKKIVERHKGHIWLESEPDKGTTFYFNLNTEDKAA
ncbi:MAG: ATP-binding protein, partial [Bdellovibrionales bacterium]